MSSKLTWPVETFRSELSRLLSENQHHIADRQNRVPGFSTPTVAQTGVLLVGAGGLGGSIAVALARKGYGRLEICDADVVELSNLNRQAFFAEDLYRPKAICLAKNAARESFLGTQCVGHHVAFAEDSAEALADRVAVAVVGVDNNATRAFTTRYLRSRGIPTIHMGVNEGADYGWVFVDEVKGPCVGCVFPHMTKAESTPQPCRPSPAVIDVLRVIGAITSYAVDSLVVAQRLRCWNFRSISLVGSAPDCVDTVRQRENCSLCGGTSGNG